MKGYYQASEQTASAIDPEGFNTRDGARRNLIIRFGLNIHPAEVEAVLNAHPAVARSAVTGRSWRDLPQES
jgi:long-chain acyl-CoA synthetase